jgi:hypothetical protein
LRGFLFSVDALLAGIVLIGGLLLISQIADFSSDTRQLSATGEDLLIGAGNIRIHELQDASVDAMIASGKITDVNTSVLDQIGYFWATNQTSEAQALSALLLGSYRPEYGLRLTIDNQELYLRNSTRGDHDRLVASRMISGIAQGKALTGSSAVAYLRRIKEKRTLSFTTFGGFVGQGNITVNFLKLPSDANVSSITLDLAAGAPFTVWFNDVQCGGTYTSPSYNGTPNHWDLSACNTSVSHRSDQQDRHQFQHVA